VDRTILLLVIAGIIIAMIILHPWPPPPSPADPIVEDADAVGKLGLSPMPEEQKALPRPLVEHPEAGSNHPLIEPSSELAERAEKVLSRPLIEYSNSTFSIALEGLQTSPTTLPRPLIEYSDSVIVFALQQPIDAESRFAQVRPRPLIEYADAGWSGGLSPPLGLLKGD
jgi:hypothetical protein